LLVGIFIVTKPIIVVLDDFERIARRYADWSAIDARAEVRIHEAPLRGGALESALAPAQVIVLMRDRTPLLADLIARLPALQLVVFTGTRNNALDVDALSARRIPVVHTEWGPSKDSTTELTWALILAAHKQLEAHIAGLRKGVWRPLDALLPTLHGKRIGLVGLGAIGGRMAKIARAFGMEVVTWSPHMTPERAAEHGAQAMALDALIASSHIISLHLVLSASTRHLFAAAQFAAMREDAIFVNTSRAGLADEAALIDALRRKRPAMAALDVYADEPLPATHPLLALPNAVMTPHLGFVCEPVFRQFYAGITHGLVAWLNGEPLANVLNADALSKL
jgi:phosphoglycerate dehydrogenase-like enzyme